MDLKVVDLAPMKVASYQYIGNESEHRAFEKLINWAKKNNLLSKKTRLFGFNNPEPSKDRPEYGYEAWIKVNNDVEGNTDIKIKNVKSGLYAVKKVNNPFPERLGEAWSDIRANMSSWMEEHNYEYDGRRQWLEEAIVKVDEVGAQFEKDPDFRIDIYLPIKKRD